MNHRVERDALVSAGRRMVALGLTHGTTGNLSVRVPGGCLITPSGVACDALEPGTLVLLRDDGTTKSGAGVPSSEWRIHTDLYRARPDAGAVVHAHPPHATAVSCLRRDLPAFHYMVVLAGGADIRCAGYATFGTAALSEQALAALDGREACLLANHGAVAIGGGLEPALELLHEVERLAEVYLLARGAGEPAVLEEAEVARLLERFRDYRRDPKLKPLP